MDRKVKIKDCASKLASTGLKWLWQSVRVIKNVDAEEWCMIAGFILVTRPDLNLFDGNLLAW